MRMQNEGKLSYRRINVSFSGIFILRLPYEYRPRREIRRNEVSTRSTAIINVTDNKSRIKHPLRFIPEQSGTIYLRYI
jgi:hypothetical protein